MKHLTTFFLLFTILFAQHAQAQNGGCVQTYLKTYGVSDINEFATVICPAPDGNLYLSGGSNNGQTIIMKVKPSGEVIWAHYFSIPTLGLVAVNNLVVDSEGKLFGCGVNSFPGDGIVFRFDPDTQTVMWLTTTDGVFGGDDLIEKEPGGNYLVILGASSGGNSAQTSIIEYDRNTGQVLPGFSNAYQSGMFDRIATIQKSGDNWYTCGTMSGGVNTNRRQVISRLAADGTEIWSVTGHIAADKPAMLFGRDLLIDGDHVVAISSGDDAENSTINQLVYIEKLSIDGEMEWVRKYDMTEFSNEFPKEILNLPDGYLIFGRNYSTPSNLFFLKVNKDGDFVWAKKINYPITYAINSTFGQSISQAVVAGNYIYVYVSARENNGNFDMLLAKMTLNGEIADDCNFISNTSAELYAVPDAVYKKFNYSVIHKPQLNGPFTPDEDSIDGPELVTRCSAGSDDGLIKVLQNITVCPGRSIEINGVSYTAPAVINDTIPSTTGACDTIATYVLNPAVQPAREEILNLCPGQTVDISGGTYSAPDTVTDTIPGIGADCDTIVTYTLNLLPRPARSETLSLCPGETVSINGVSYAAPALVTDTIPSTTGACDTIVTYTLQLPTFPQPSLIQLNCPPDITVSAANAAVHYPDAVAATNCICDDVTLYPTAGLPSGSTFPVGVTLVCFQAVDLCGSSADCCFNITVNASPSSPACDVKTIGCVTFELLNIQQNSAREKTYRVRITNNCTGALRYAALQLPDGMDAVMPAGGSVFSSAGGRDYAVRNPNYTPFYSIRFKPQAAGIVNGQSDVFSYTLPPQADPTFILAAVRLESQAYYEAHLNTFYCPIEQVSDAQNRAGEESYCSDFQLFPNPSAGLVQLRLPLADMTVEVLNARGALVFRQKMAGQNVSFEMPPTCGNGLYFLRATGPDGTSIGAPLIRE